MSSGAVLAPAAARSAGRPRLRRRPAWPPARAGCSAKRAGLVDHARRQRRHRQHVLRRRQRGAQQGPAPAASASQRSRGLTWKRQPPGQPVRACRSSPGRRADRGFVLHREVGLDRIAEDHRRQVAGKLRASTL
jgi:hypothetical protein